MLAAHLVTGRRVSSGWAGMSGTRARWVPRREGERSVVERGKTAGSRLGGETVGLPPSTGDTGENAMSNMSPILLHPNKVKNSMRSGDQFLP